MSLTFSKNSSCLTIFLNGVLHTIPGDAPNFKAVWNAVKSNDEALVVKALDVVETIQEAFEAVIGSGVEVTPRGVFFNGSPMHNALSAKIMAFMQEGIPFDPLVKFLNNFLQNPVVTMLSNSEARALAPNLPTLDQFTDDFYSFLDHRSMPITENGYFLAYKTLDGSYWSKRGGTMKLVKGKTDNSGRIYNAPGQEIECERNEVDPNRINECSYGLHVGCLEYSGPGGWYNSSGDKVVVVMVHPKDVVAVPPDCNRTKMRVCAYTVVQDFVSSLDKPAYRDDVEDEDFDLYDDDYSYHDDEYETSGDLDSPEDIFIGDEIRFTYTKEGASSTRFADVTEMIKDPITGKLARIVGVLLEPEENEGEYRTFLTNRISDIQLIYKG